VPEHRFLLLWRNCKYWDEAAAFWVIILLILERFSLTYTRKVAVKQQLHWQKSSSLIPIFTISDRVPGTESGI
jgi:hypothetical protein